MCTFASTLICVLVCHNSRLHGVLPPLPAHTHTHTEDEEIAQHRIESLQCQKI